MAPPRDQSAAAVLARLLEEHRLSNDSLLYREVERDALRSTGASGHYRLPANPHPTEAVVDIYGPGYVVQAETMGAGLAFTDALAKGWQETMELRALRTGAVAPNPGARALVEVRLGDLLNQGGLMYPVESVTTERAWYFTLPAGGVEVREVGPV